MRKAVAKAPGKLYIAGEYAVVEAGHPAILMAVDQFLTVHITESNKRGTVHPIDYTAVSIPWSRKNGKFTFLEEHSLDILERTLQITEQYIDELDKNFIRSYDVTIKSDLDDANGKKYGLGSSAAVTIATIRALLSFYNVETTDELIFKLACLVHQSLDSNGSMGDLAISTYTGWIAYHSYDRVWVKEKMKNKNYSIINLLEIDWPGLAIERLTPPPGLNYLVGWTGSPASTSDLVTKIKKIKDTAFYKDFTENSKICVETLIIAIKQNEIEQVEAMIQKNRQLLLDLADYSGVAIETPLLKTLIEIAEKHHAFAKTSGAGGGDCGIAFLNASSQRNKIIDEWKDNQIKLLNFNTYTKD